MHVLAKIANRSFDFPSMGQIYEMAFPQVIYLSIGQ
jgi:hypothetical protein